MEFNSLKLNKKRIISLVSLLALSLLIILFINFISSRKEVSSLNSIYNQIKQYNNFNELISDDEIQTDKIISALSNKNNELESIKDSLNKISVKDNETELKNNLLDNLDYNTQLNDLCLSLLNNPKPNDLISIYNKYSKTYNLLLNNYDSLKNSGINLNFDKDAKDFFNYIAKHFSTLISLSRDKDIKSLQRNTYITNLNNCIDAFEKIGEDLEPAIDKIREDDRDLNNLIKDIKDKKSALSSIKNQSYCINIPENGTKSYNLLQDTINYYGIYINSLESSIEFEKTCDTSKAKNKVKIEENYKNSFSKYSDFENSLKNLRTELDNFNNK